MKRIYEIFEENEMIILIENLFDEFIYSELCQKVNWSENSSTVTKILITATYITSIF